MPGIEVDSDGRISFEGKNIDEFYVEGLDLLGSKYNLLSSNLPFTEVDSIQVLQNHQPKKILRDLIPTDDVSLNVTLKNKRSITGVAKVNSGSTLNSSPEFLWDLNTTPMLLSAEKQILFSLQSNNLGEDISTQLKEISIKDLDALYMLDLPQQHILGFGIPHVVQPLDNTSDLLFNRSNLASINYITKKKDKNIRFNIDYLNDQRQELINTQTNYHLPEVFTVREQLDLSNIKNQMKGNFILENNTSENYFTNQLNFVINQDHQNARLITSSNQKNQTSQAYNWDFKNRISGVKKVGKHLLDYSSLFLFHSSNESLNTDTLATQVATLFPSQATQNIHTMKIQSYNTLQGSFGRKVFLVQSKLVINIEGGELHSDLTNQEGRLLDTDYQNDLSNWTITPSIENNLTFKPRKGVNFTLRIPLSYLLNKFDDRILDAQQNNQRLLFSPSFVARYQMNSRWQINHRISYTDRFDNRSMYNGYILNTYNQLERGSRWAKEDDIFGVNSSIRYRNLVKAFFFKGTYSYQMIHKNYMLDNSIYQSGLSQVKLSDQKNIMYQQVVNVKLSKSFMNGKSFLSLDQLYTQTEQQMKLNQNLSEFSTYQYRLKLAIETHPNLWFGLSAEPEFLSSWTKSNGQDFFHLEEFRANLETFFFFKKHTIKVYNKIYTTNTDNPNLYFTDLSYQYTFQENRRIDLEFRWHNIFNKTLGNIYLQDRFYTRIQEFPYRSSRILLCLKTSF